MKPGLDGQRVHHGVLVVDSTDTLNRVLVPVLRRHATAGDPVLMIAAEGTEEVLALKVILPAMLRQAG